MHIFCGFMFITFYSADLMFSLPLYFSKTFYFTNWYVWKISKLHIFIYILIKLFVLTDTCTCKNNLYFYEVIMTGSCFACEYSGNISLIEKLKIIKKISLYLTRYFEEQQTLCVWVCACVCMQSPVVKISFFVIAFIFNSFI